MDLVLIRHAEPERIEIAEGPADPVLRERGHDQARRLARWLRDETLDAVWTSPLRRARQTAEALVAGRGLELRVDDGLAEFDRLATSYIPYEELKANRDDRYLAMLAGGFDHPDVDVDAFRRDVVGAVERVVASHPGQRAAVVAHGGVINVYLGHILGLSRPLWFEPGYTSISRVAAARTGERGVVSVNETGHLRPDVFSS